jgi:DNA invertase Pin-like site-specific DNA recombinase
MAKGRFIAYYRVSTKGQAESGLGLEAQRTAVTRFLNGGEWELVEEVTEIESGKRNDRPKLAEALRLCRIYNAELIIAKLDRLSRNVYFISALMESGVKFVAADMPQATDMTIHILASVAQGEAKAISERTRVALAAAKARGQQLGGLRSNSATIHIKGNAQSIQVRQERASKKANDLLPVIEQAKASGASSLREIAAVLNKRKIHTSRGGKWSAVQVQRILQRNGTA